MLTTIFGVVATLAGVALGATLLTYVVHGRVRSRKRDAVVVELDRLRAHLIYDHPDVSPFDIAQDNADYVELHRRAHPAGLDYHVP